MTYAGTLHENELFIRCPYCGDSQNNKRKAHFSIHTRRFVYHCFRCGVAGKLTDGQILSLLAELPNLSKVLSKAKNTKKLLLLQDILDAINPGAGSPRHSTLTRFHYKEADAFLSRSCTGQTVGIQIRPKEKEKIKTYGISAFGFAEETLISTPKNSLRIVEGTYDVLYPNDVCVFGTINKGSLQGLIGHYIVLCPDGDIWQRPDLYKEFHRTIKHLLYNKNGLGAWIQGIEFLDNGKDPDEVKEQDREFIPIREYSKISI